MLRINRDFLQRPVHGRLLRSDATYRGYVLAIRGILKKLDHRCVVSMYTSSALTRQIIYDFTKLDDPLIAAYGGSSYIKT